MKKICILLLAVLAGGMILAAGCMGLPGAIPGVPQAPASPGDGPSFAGKWMTTWQGGGHDVPMTLSVSGSAVTGTYDYNGGTIAGTVQGDRLIGTWTEDSGQSMGPVEFVMAGDGRSFAGWWGYEGEDFAATKQDRPSWTGLRV